MTSLFLENEVLATFQALISCRNHRTGSGISACRHIFSDTVTVLNEKLSFRKVRGANGAERDTSRHIPQIESALDTHMGYHGQRHALMTE